MTKGFHLILFFLAIADSGLIQDYVDIDLDVITQSEDFESNESEDSDENEDYLDKEVNASARLFWWNNSTVEKKGKFFEAFKHFAKPFLNKNGPPPEFKS